MFKHTDESIMENEFMNISYKKRVWVVLALAVLSFIILACSCSLLNGIDDVTLTEEPAPGDAPSEVSIPESYFEFGTGPFDLPDPAVGLAGLSSYRSILTLTFNGQRNGQTEQWSRTFEMTASQQDTIFHQMVVQATGQADGQPLSGQYLAETSGTQYEQVEGAECQAAIMGEGTTPLADDWEPARILTPLRGADEAGMEDVNGVSANHYTFDARALGLSGLGSGSGEAWVASEGGYLLKYTFPFEGSEEYFGEGEGVIGTLTWEYELLDINQPVALTLPEGCPYGRVDVPILDDATETDEMPGTTTYKTTATIEEVITFYQEQLPGMGWEEVAEPALSEGGGAVTFVQGETQLTILAILGEDGTTVWLMLENRIAP
jgi:hypothetical protein